jgi:hypothetical protein
MVGDQGSAKRGDASACLGAHRSVSNDSLKLKRAFESRQVRTVEKPHLWPGIVHSHSVKLGVQSITLGSSPCSLRNSEPRQARDCTSAANRPSRRLFGAVKNCAANTAADGHRKRSLPKGPSPADLQQLEVVRSEPFEIFLCSPIVLGSILRTFHSLVVQVPIPRFRFAISLPEIRSGSPSEPHSRLVSIGELNTRCLQGTLYRFDCTLLQ